MQQARFLTRIIMLIAVATWFTACSSSGGDSTPANPPPVIDATLSALTFSGGDLDQIFQSSQTDYTATVNFLQTSVTVTATATDAASTITINGTAVASGVASPAIALAEGANAITILVTASDGVTTETYTLTITKQAAVSFAQQAYLKASNAETEDRFGFTVAVDGDTLVVGAPFENSSSAGSDELEPDAGAAYVFIRSGTSWTQQALLKAANAETLDEFGTSVAISGETVAVGAIGKNLDAGAVYVFVRSGATWSQQQQLAAGGAVPGDDVGISVAIDGDTLVAGARGGDGAAYVFTRSGVTWSEQQKLTASDAAAGDQFGSSVGLDGDTVVIGAPGKDSSGNEAGAAYVFTLSGPNWSEQQILEASNADPNDNFGASVAIEGDTVAVGAPFEDSGASSNNEGAAYVYTRTGTNWTEQTKLTASDAAVGDFFGGSVAISAEGLVVGAASKASSAGAAYVFTGGGASWSEQAILTASNAEAGDQFGSSLAISGGTVVIGAPQEDSSAAGGEADDSQLQAGAAYVWE